ARPGDPAALARHRRRALRDPRRREEHGRRGGRRDGRRRREHERRARRERRHLAGRAHGRGTRGRRAGSQRQHRGTERRMRGDELRVDVAARGREPAEGTRLGPANEGMSPRGGGKPAVLLLSGGLDSTTLLALATKEGYAVNALTFRYGQRHELETGRAAAIAARYAVARHVVADIDLRPFGGSALTSDIAVPKDRGA